MDPTTVCYIVMGSLFGGGCLFGGVCLYCSCYEPNRVTPRTTLSADYIIEQKRYNDLINSPPEYQPIADQPLPTNEDIVPPPDYILSSYIPYGNAAQDNEAQDNAENN
jgi:hypothetical protein